MIQLQEEKENVEETAAEAKRAGEDKILKGILFSYRERMLKVSEKRHLDYCDIANRP